MHGGFITHIAILYCLPLESFMLCCKSALFGGFVGQPFPRITKFIVIIRVQQNLRADPGYPKQTEFPHLNFLQLHICSCTCTCACVWKICIASSQGCSQ